MSRLFALTCLSALALTHTAISQDAPADNTQYMETHRPGDKQFVTSITRITACKITAIRDPRQVRPIYPPGSREHQEQGEVLMQLVIDSDYCVRKATILKTSSFARLDKAALDYVMNLKFSAELLSNIKTLDDGQLAFAFPLVWKIYDSADRCSTALACVDEAPPPAKIENPGTPPEPGDLWMPGYYVHYARTGYQWNDGQWEAPRPGFHWDAPRWEKYNAKWIFTAGSWQPDK